MAGPNPFFEQMARDKGWTLEQQVQLLLEHAESIGASMSVASFARNRSVEPNLLRYRGRDEGMGIFEDYRGPDNPYYPSHQGGPFSPWGGRRSEPELDPYEESVSVYSDNSGRRDGVTCGTCGRWRSR